MSGCVIPTKGGLFQHSPGDSALPEVRSSKSRDQAVGERLKVGVGPRFFFTSPKLDDTSGRFILKGKDGCCLPSSTRSCVCADVSGSSSGGSGSTGSSGAAAQQLGPLRRGENAGPP